MSKIGPQDLFALGELKLVWEAPGVKVFEGEHPKGGTYGEILADAGKARVLDLCYAIEHFHGNALLRDAFNEDGDICINFWKGTI
ncbi:hypothetical protein ACTMTF_15465 [Nonomuraea sp. ZG12]|uniref:hypothetical protein n=1 Tax=Nonomuraea sp. ZG12 TaxID=3452207 RepID=UPI003F899297